ncbi:serine hydrolase [Variovorax saccharolyticus]|uniref:serine hydrolase n=1 Tax=Variovorax saccharolyticus TaxID=3053516 RepID=UPI002575BF55|nr:serine hydrolase domain-containing protein [Variovorax sp. J22R187]MDM0022135.1 serine hydrolase domain-containing protein [Variovorax sp. J22R187]
MPAGNLIDLADLAGNQSGQADYSMLPGFFEVFAKDTLHIWTPQELVAFSFAVTPAFLSGEHYQYSNTNTVLLGMVIEAVTGPLLGEVLAARVFRPLGLSGTSYPTSAKLPPPTPRPMRSTSSRVASTISRSSARLHWRVPAPSHPHCPTCSCGATRWVSARSSVRNARVCANRARKGHQRPRVRPLRPGDRADR